MAVFRIFEQEASAGEDFRGQIRIPCEILRGIGGFIVTFELQGGGVGIRYP